MPTPHVDQCACPLCRYEAAHQDKDYHRELMAFLATLSREQRRLYAAVESNRLGSGGAAKVAAIMGLCEPTIARGRRDLQSLFLGQSPKKEHKPIRGRPRTEEQDPSITAVLEEMLSDEVAGSPEGGERWVRSSSRKLAERLKEKGFPVSYQTVWRLLKRIGFSMKTGVRKRRGISPDPGQRDEQFLYMRSQRRAYLAAGLPVISVDTKQKELIGNFKRKGRTWCREAPEVDDYDFPSLAECIAVPYGIYDLKQNAGYVVVGLSYNTPEFAVSSICQWWQEAGLTAYPEAKQILIFADGGGANGSRARAWKWNLQKMFCNRFGLVVSVCHYPPGCSKWNPVEYRLFSEISKNWEGKPLRSLRIMLGYIRGTTTTMGLRVMATLDEGVYKKGQKVTWQDVDKLKIEHASVCPDWNYTISPEV